MIKTIKNYIYILLPSEQKLTLLLLFMTLIAVLMDIAGVTDLVATRMNYVWLP